MFRGLRDPRIAISGRIMSLLLLLMLLALSADAKTFAVGPDDSLQGAIFMARTGDVVLVSEGTYYEHIRVDKSIILRGQMMPVLDATASGSAITLLADGITVEGFKIVNAGSWPSESPAEAGIKVLSEGNRIIKNDVSNNFNGILLVGVKNNSILDNTVRRNLGYGIRLEKAFGNIICNNSLEENSLDAFDEGLNFWDRNYYSEFDNSAVGRMDRGDGQSGRVYSIPGGKSVDEHPRYGIL
jgi:parallel beta-helix repeat protein